MILYLPKVETWSKISRNLKEWLHSRKSADKEEVASTFSDIAIWCRGSECTEVILLPLGAEPNHTVAIPCPIFWCKPAGFLSDKPTSLGIWLAHASGLSVDALESCVFL